MAIGLDAGSGIALANESPPLRPEPFGTELWIVLRRMRGAGTGRLRGRLSAAFSRA